MSKIIPIILSGGHGTRLWPLSRKMMPKQFIAFWDDKSLFQLTLERVLDDKLYHDPIIICAKDHRFLVKDILRDMQLNRVAHVLCEVEGRNTAPALAAALHAAKTLYPAEDEPQFLVLPADHHIPDIQAFNKTVRLAKPAVKNGSIMTFGIQPQSPHTGFGYIQSGSELENCYKVLSFKEKPDVQTAQSYIDQGGYYWNAGIFMTSGIAFEAEMQRLHPQTLKNSQYAWENAEEDLRDYILNPDDFSHAESISIDYAVMEHTDRAAIIPAGFEWNDLGSWDALWDVSNKSHENNVLQGDIKAVNTQNCFLHSDRQMIGTVGIKDLIIVATSDAILVTPRSQSEHVKSLIDAMKEDERSETIHGDTVYRPWGAYQVLEDQAHCKVKRIFVTPGKKLSLQKHNHRSEHWVVVEGTARVTKDDEIFDLKANESTYIPVGCVHRLENTTTKKLEIIEVQTGTYFGEDDIIRLEDDFNRTDKD